MASLTCSGTLLRHLDGTTECESHHRCGSDPLVHEWALDCSLLGCDCVAEQPAPHQDALPIAA